MTVTGHRSKPTSIVMVPPIEYVLGYRLRNKVQPKKRRFLLLVTC